MSRLPLVVCQLIIISLGSDLDCMNVAFFFSSATPFTVLITMAKCSYCGINFPLLDDQDNEVGVCCSKCTLQVPGISIPEIAAINVCLTALLCGHEKLKLK